METIDKTGQISEIKDIEESIKSITKFMVKDLIKLPELGVQAMMIKQCLEEYLHIRNKLK